LIVAETSKVTIYDGVDGSMWMVFNIGSNYHLGGTSGISSLVARSGLLYVGNSSNGLSIIDFISDRTEQVVTSTSIYRELAILGRNEPNSYNPSGNDSIVSSNINDVTLTSDGNMNNTVAVATDGGVSVIHPDGSVDSWTDTQASAHLSKKIIAKDDILTWIADTSQTGKYGWIMKVNDVKPVIWNNRNISGLNTEVFSAGKFNISHSNLILAMSCLAYNAIGSNRGLTKYLPDYDALENTSICQITDTFNSGYMQGDIKGCFLANHDREDRSINANILTRVGSINSAPVATGAELMAYSGFSASNYLEQSYNADLDFGTNDFYVMGWVKCTTNADYKVIIDKGHIQASGIRLVIDNNGIARGSISTDTDVISTRAIDDGVWHFVAFIRGLMYIDGDVDGIQTQVGDASSASEAMRLGVRLDGGGVNNGSLALIRIGEGAPRAKQINEIYNAERPLFQENARCLLQGSSSDVKALDYDESTGLLTVCSATHITKLNGLMVASDEPVAGTSVSTVSGKELKGVA